MGDNEKRTSGRLNELKELNNIRGEFCISNLGWVRDVASESQETNLRSKKYIQDLYLLWGAISDSGEYEIKNSNSLMLLDNLCPHQNPRSISVSGFSGVRFSDWLISLTNIVIIKFYHLPNCKHVPHLERLPCLKGLEIDDMDELECMHYYEKIGDVFFPSLEKLSIQSCMILRGWERLGDNKNSNDETDFHLSLPPFPRLSSLQIRCCPELTCMPTFPYLVEKLDLQLCSMIPMWVTCVVKHESSSFCSLSALKHLHIWDVRATEAMAEECMKNLTSLQSLRLGESSTAELLLQQLQHLPSQLRELDIRYLDCDKLELWKEKSSDSSQCRGCPCALSSLQKISFICCKNMKALPEQIGYLQSLREILIGCCDRVESLQEAESCLANIQSLHIVNCPLLERRYSSESGEDRHKIAHIPNIMITD